MIGGGRVTTSDYSNLQLEKLTNRKSNCDDNKIKYP